MFFAEKTVFLSAIANPRRLEILTILVTGESSVGALSQRVGLSQSALSQHLSILREAGLVDRRKEAQQVFYWSSSASVKKVLDLLSQVSTPHPVRWSKFASSPINGDLLGGDLKSDSPHASEYEDEWYDA